MSENFKREIQEHLDRYMNQYETCTNNLRGFERGTELWHCEARKQAEILGKIYGIRKVIDITGYDFYKEFTGVTV